jgi:hypothetical protein
MAMLSGGGQGSPQPPPQQPQPQPQPRPQPRPSAPLVTADQVDVASIMPHLIQQESSGQPGVLGPQTDYGRAEGLTQMLPATAQEMANRLGVPWRPELMRGTSQEAADYQRQLGQAYFEQGLRETGNLRDAFMYYHGGPDRSLWGPRTNRYADQLMARVQGGAPVSPITPTAGPSGGAESLSDEQLLAALNEQAASDVADDLPEPPAPDIRSPSGRRPITGAIMDPVTGGSQGQPIDVESLSPAQINSLGEGFRGQYIRQPDGSVALVRDIGEPTGDIGDPSQVGQSGIRYYEADPNMERMGAFSQALAEQVPFGMDYVRGITGAITGEGYSNTADLLDDAAAEQRQFNPNLRRAGGLAGFGASMGLPGVGAADRWVRGAQGAERLRRAALSGALFGGVYGAGTGRGGIDERITRGVEGAGIGAATGGAVQGVLDNVLPRMAAGSSPQRRLSRQGIDLTPGQMVESIPIAGPVVRQLEDQLTGIPFVGAAIQGARDVGTGQLNRIPLADALDAIGERLPRGVKPGNTGVEFVQGRMGAAYDDVLSRAQAQLDNDFVSETRGIMQTALDDLPTDHYERLARILATRVVDRADSSGQLAGDALKRVESDLRLQAERIRRTSRTDAYADDMADALMDIRGALRNAIARTTPTEAARLQDINRGYASLAMAERLAGGNVALGNGGIATAAQFSNVANEGLSRGQRARLGGRYSQLGADAREVLPNTVGDSGTSGRAVAALLLAGGATAAPVIGSAAVPVVAGMAAYTRPAQMLINGIYRATDPRQAAQALERLGLLAQKVPALQSYYQDAARHLQSLTSGDTAAAQGQPQPQSARLAQ